MSDAAHQAVDGKNYIAAVTSAWAAARHAGTAHMTANGLEPGKGTPHAAVATYLSFVIGPACALTDDDIGEIRTARNGVDHGAADPTREAAQRIVTAAHAILTTALTELGSIDSHP